MAADPNFLNLIGAPSTGFMSPFGYVPGRQVAPVQKPQKPSGWQQSIDAVKEAKRTGGQLPPRAGGSTYYGPGGDPSGTGRGQAQQRPQRSAPAPDAGDANNGGGSLPSGGAGPSNTETRTNALGATQTGRNLGKVNLPELDMTGIADFAGPSFPTQPGTNKITDGYKNTGGANGYGLADDEVDSGKFTVIGGKKYAISQEAVQDQQDYGFKGPSMPASDGAVDSNDSFNGNMDENGLDDNDFGGPDPADYASSGEEMRRRAAFLDADNSMAGLIAVENGMGIKYAGGNHYAHIDGKAVKMDSDGEFSARNIKNAAPGKAQALKDGYVQALRDRANKETDTPSTEQNPVTESGIAAFKGNSPLGDTRYGEQIPGNPSPVEFNNNNSQDTPGFNLSIPNKNQDPNQFDLRKNFYI